MSDESRRTDPPNDSSGASDSSSPRALPAEWLSAAAALATVVGVQQLSRARLADHLQVPIEQINTHFDNDEVLQMAAIEDAVRAFKQDILWPANSVPPGLARLRAVCSNFLEHVRRPAYPGGCFFASAASELDTCPGHAQQRVRSVHHSWMRYLELCVREAQRAGEIRPDEDYRQVAFEIDALLALGNVGFVLYGDHTWVQRAEQGIERLVARLAREPE